VFCTLEKSDRKSGENNARMVTAISSPRLLFLGSSGNSEPVLTVRNAARYRAVLLAKRDELVPVVGGVKACWTSALVDEAPESLATQTLSSDYAAKPW
jgi:hypothetical protein